MVILALVLSFNYARNTAYNKEITYNEFISLLENKEISKVVITSENLIITPSKNNQEYEGKTLYTANINDNNLISKLNELGVDYEGKREHDTKILDIIFVWFMPTILFVLVPIAVIFFIAKYIGLKKENKILKSQLKGLVGNMELKKDFK